MSRLCFSTSIRKHLLKFPHYPFKPYPWCYGLYRVFKTSFPYNKKCNRLRYRNNACTILQKVKLSVIIKNTLHGTLYNIQYTVYSIQYTYGEILNLISSTHFLYTFSHSVYKSKHYNMFLIRGSWFLQIKNRTIVQ